MIPLRRSWFLSLAVSFLLLASVQAQAPAAVGNSPSISREGGDNFVATLQEGGITVVVQLALSVFAGGFVIERFAKLRRRRIAPPSLAEKARTLWKSGRMTELEELGQTDGSTLARAISFITRHRNNSVTDVSTMVGDLVSHEMDGHHQCAYPLGVIATLEPLLGLLGMIMGMISTFKTVSLHSGALGDPSQLAAGISEALVTTGVGLAIAIPCLTFFHFFQSRTNRLTLLLEKEVTDLIGEWLMAKSDAR